MCHSTSIHPRVLGLRTIRGQTTWVMDMLEACENRRESQSQLMRWQLWCCSHVDMLTGRCVLLPENVPVTLMITEELHKMEQNGRNYLFKRLCRPSVYKPKVRMVIGMLMQKKEVPKHWLVDICDTLWYKRENDLVHWQHHTWDLISFILIFREHWFGLAEQIFLDCRIRPKWAPTAQFVCTLW